MQKQTSHRVNYRSAGELNLVDERSVDLVVTSPPYPMIEMWDRDFCVLNGAIQTALSAGECARAFNLMHEELDKVWNRLHFLVKDGGIVCVNVGDATRTVKENFQLFSSHSRIINKFLSIGFQNLPNIIWRKTTNAPNKFMGSGMLPPGAYVTLEHEYILVFRKGGKRNFKTPSEKQLRRESAFFWEERNQWFSDVWFDLKGAGQDLNHDDLRKRSAAFPFELAYRLINMFSVKGDLILDPFLGTGTTMFAAMAAERNSMGYEIDENFRRHISNKLPEFSGFANKMIQTRIASHGKFMEERLRNGNPPKFEIQTLGLPCVSRQESDMILRYIGSIEDLGDDTYKANYTDISDGAALVTTLSPPALRGAKRELNRDQIHLNLK
jgi:DNA modification methylase